MLKSDTDFAAFVGIDWADRKHDVCLALGDGDKLELSVLPHRPSCIEAWAQSLRIPFNLSARSGGT